MGGLNTAAMSSRLWSYPNHLWSPILLLVLDDAASWKGTGEKDIGLISEEVAESIHNLVALDLEGTPKSVKYR